MISALLGIIAAVAWGLHDFIGRFVTRALGSTLTFLLVILSGVSCLAVVVVARGEGFSIDTADLPLVALTGFVYAGALYFLFAGLKTGSLALVVLIAASFPATTVLIAIARGTPPTAVQLVAIAAVLIGMSMVIGNHQTEAAAGDADQDAPRPPPNNNRRAIAFAALAHICFAVSITIGQQLVDQIDGASLTLAIRLTGLLLIPLLLIGRDRPATSRLGRWMPLAIAMGCLDVIGLGAVLAAGAYPFPQLGPVVSSGYGAVAVVLALVVLRERLGRLQIFGIALSIAGTVVLALPPA